MTEEELKKGMDKVYAVGFKNGQIDMKNRILKRINRDWNLLPIHLGIKVLKVINNIKLKTTPTITH